MSTTQNPLTRYTPQQLRAAAEVKQKIEDLRARMSALLQEPAAVRPVYPSSKALRKAARIVECIGRLKARLESVITGQPVAKKADVAKVEAPAVKPAKEPKAKKRKTTRKSKEQLAAHSLAELLKPALDKKSDFDAVATIQAAAQQLTQAARPIAPVAFQILPDPRRAAELDRTFNDLLRAAQHPVTSANSTKLDHLFQPNVSAAPSSLLGTTTPAITAPVSSAPSVSGQVVEAPASAYIKTGGVIEIIHERLPGGMTPPGA